MDRYGIVAPGATISNDGDALGRLEDAQRIARTLRAAVRAPDSRALTSLVAQIRVPAGADGRVRNVDVLHLLYTVGGLRKSREFTEAVIRDSVEMEWKPGHRIRVMHPLHVLDSRIQNTAGLLADKGPHVLTQATWAIAVAREAMLRVLDRADEHARLGAMIRQVHNLARSRAGRHLLREHGIDVLDAVPVAQIRAALPGHEPQLQAVERAIAARSNA
jgi:hypothetical protein